LTICLALLLGRLETQAKPSITLRTRWNSAGPLVINLK
jgi:hypothetical protein